MKFLKSPNEMNVYLTKAMPFLNDPVAPFAGPNAQKYRMNLFDSSINQVIPTVVEFFIEDDNGSGDES